MRWARVKKIQGTVSGSTTMTRPGDTTPYANGDEISNNTSAGSAAPWVFSDLVIAAGGGGVLLSVDLWTSDTGFSGNTLAVHLFTASPTMAGDNTKVIHATTDFSAFLNASSLYATSPSTTGFIHSTYPGYANQIMLPFRCATGSRALYGVINSSGSPTPQNASTWMMTLTVGYEN